MNLWIYNKCNNFRFMCDPANNLCFGWVILASCSYTGLFLWKPRLGVREGRSQRTSGPVVHSLLPTETVGTVLSCSRQVLLWCSGLFPGLSHEGFCRLWNFYRLPLSKIFPLSMYQFVVLFCSLFHSHDCELFIFNVFLHCQGESAFSSHKTHGSPYPPLGCPPPVPF